MRFRPRILSGTLRRAATTFPAILVTGPRQSGKTTLLRHEFEKTHAFVSLERPDVRARARADSLGFLADHPPPVILDEIQLVPELLHYVKDRIDADRRPGQWLLSGSQSFPLMQGISQTLAGRVAVLTLQPLSVDEAHAPATLATVDDLLQRVFSAPTEAGRRRRSVDLADWLLRGGYPEPRLDPSVDRQLWFASYVQTYLERDVRDVLQVADLASFNRFVALVAARTGSLLNMTDLGRDAGVTGPTVKRWLSVMETSNLIYLLRPYHANFGKRVTKSAKPYFIDPGVLTFLLGLHNREPLLRGPSLGAILESAVIAEWLKSCQHRGERPQLYHWRSSGGLEVDLVIERDQQLYGIEIKATATPSPRHAEALARWIELAGDRARGVVACNIDRPMALRPGIRAVPWHLAW